MRALILGVAWAGMLVAAPPAGAEQPPSAREQAVVSELAEVKESLQALSLKVDALQRELGAAANPQPAGARRMFAMTYRVADLVPELQGDFAVSWNPDRLVRHITTHIAPQQWDVTGRAGRIAVYHADRSLVITQTAEVHSEIGQLLSRLRETKLILDEITGISRSQPVAQTGFDPEP